MKYILYIFIILFAKVSLGQSDSIIPPKLKESSLLEASLLGNYNDLWKNFKHINGPVIEREGKVLERVKLTLFIDENGNPSDVKIVKSSNKENYDKYIVNKFNTKEQWTPAFINSKTIKSQVLVFINEGRITHIQLLSSYEKEVFKPVEKIHHF